MVASPSPLTSSHPGKGRGQGQVTHFRILHPPETPPENEMVVFAGDMNGHVGSSNVGYDGTHGGFGCGSSNADGSRILEFADGLKLVICNTLFTKQEAKLVTVVRTVYGNSKGFEVKWVYSKVQH